MQVGNIQASCQALGTVRKNSAVSFEGENQVNSYGEKASTLKRIPVELALGSGLGAGIVKLFNVGIKEGYIDQVSYRLLNDADKLNKKAALTLVGIMAAGTVLSTELPKLYFKAVDTISAKIFGGHKKD